MKCISCNNEIPDASTVCPYCRSNVTPVAPATPVFNVNNSDTSVLPTVPTTPVLPQDQHLDMTGQMNLQQNGDVPSEPQNNVNADVAPQEQVPVPESVQTMQTQEALEPESVPQVMEVATNSAPEVSGMESNQQVIEPQENVSNVNLETQNTVALASESAPQVETPANNNLVNDINPEFIAPNGDSVKLDNTKAVEAPKKKTNLLVIIIIAAVILVIGVLGALFYFSQFKSADKRIDKIINAITSSASSIKNDEVDKSSGTYNAELSVSYGNENISGKISGKYATDLSGKAIDFTFNLESLNMGSELVDSPINVELYYADSRIYVLLQNFYENYIYEEYPNFDELFNANEQNNINYVAIIDALKNALGQGLKAMRSDQRIGNATINGTTKRANIIKITFNEANNKMFMRGLLRSLVNNSSFISEYAKLSGESEEEIKEEIQSVIDEDTYDVDFNNATMEIYTAMFGQELYGIKVSYQEENEKAILEVYPVVNGYSLSYKIGSQKYLEATLVSASKTTSTTKEKTYTIDFTVYANEEAYKVNLTLENVRDVSPKDAHVNVKNSINKKYLTQEDKILILEKVGQAGNIGLYLPSLITSLLFDGEDPLAREEVDPCMQAVNCIPSQDPNYNTCQIPETLEYITCPIAQ